MTFEKHISGCRKIQMIRQESCLGGITVTKLQEWEIELHWLIIIPGITVILLW